MASTTSNNSNRPPHLLEDLTNQASDPHVTSTDTKQGFETAYPSSRPLRRKSSRNITSTNKSSESVSCEPDADPICNAQTVDAESMRIENMSSPAGSVVIAPLAVLTSDDQYDLPRSHSRWPKPRLEPILERRKHNLLRSHRSVPRLQPSPKRMSKVVKPQISARSIHLSSIPPPLPFDTSPTVSRCRSFSLNDLDCLPKSDTQEAISSKPRRRFSWSENTTEIFHCCLSFPVTPTYPPPYRSPTPPGLPSFGTMEAQRYRLVQLPPRSRATSLFQKCFGSWCHESEELPADQVTPSTSAVTCDQILSPTMIALKRMMGRTQVVKLLPEKSNPRSALPQRVQLASNCGPLAYADDGSLVRGYWNDRTGMHGISHGPLSAHPLAYVSGLQSTDDVITHIDKAHGDADEDNRHREMMDTRCITEASSEHAERFMPQQAFCHQEFGSSMHPQPLQLPPFEFANSLPRLMLPGPPTTIDTTNACCSSYVGPLLT